LSTRPPRYLSRRAFDLVVGIPLALVALPLVLLFAAILAVRFRANPFFVHNRIGYGGRSLAVPKLRTLAPTTNPYTHKWSGEIQPEPGLPGWLRRSHLDELPQLLQVITGRISLVGPRPRMECESAEHGDEDFEEIRTRIPQGCTGLWQISRARAEPLANHPEFDLLYIANHSVLLDSWILWRTFRKAVFDHHVDIDDIPRWLLRDPDCARTPAAS